jgi:2,3-bisphosphoglycerate-independent phosphoglycerate mutase
MKLLFLFLDGVGLGKNDPIQNPFANANLPNLNHLLEEKRLVESSLPNAQPTSDPTSSYDKSILITQRVTLVPLDPCLGVAGIPQSATGQATLLTGINVPGELGYHYGPKPSPAVAEFILRGNLFKSLKLGGCNTGLLNAYPPAYFSAIDSGRRLYSAIPLAAIHAGMKLKTKADLFAGDAISADFTGQGWRDHLGILDAPVLTPCQAGDRLANIAMSYDFSFFEYWLSDFAGHKQDMISACSLLETFDQVLGGLVDKWIDNEGLILITSDHGNIEDLSMRHHTNNSVPALVIGTPHLREIFCSSLHDLTDITPAILRLMSIS